MLYVKTTALALIAAGSVAPVLALHNEDYLTRREVLDELAEVLAREYAYDLSTREYGNYESLSRRGFYDVDEDIFQRAPSMVEDASLERRDLHPEYAEVLARYFSDLEEREPDPNVIQWFKNLFHHKKKDDKKKATTTTAASTSTTTPTSTSTSTPTQTPQSANPPAQDGTQTPVDDGSYAAADPNTVSSRELYGRDESEYEKLVMRHFNDLYARGLAAEAESYGLSAREFEDSLELFQRSPDPNVIQWFKNLFHHKKDDKKKAATTTTSSTPTQTSTQPVNPPAPSPTDDGSSSVTDPNVVTSRELYEREQLEYEDLLMRYYDDIYGRELAAGVDYSDITAREFEDESELELFQRSPDPNVIDWFKNLFHHKKKDDKKAQNDDGSSSTSDVSSREFDDFYYDLD